LPNFNKSEKTNSQSLLIAKFLVKKQQEDPLPQSARHQGASIQSRRLKDSQIIPFIILCFLSESLTGLRLKHNLIKSKLS
jgi:hypothetical protein